MRLSLAKEHCDQNQISVTDKYKLEETGMLSDHREQNQIKVKVYCN